VREAQARSKDALFFFDDYCPMSIICLMTPPSDYSSLIIDAALDERGIQKRRVQE